MPAVICTGSWLDRWPGIARLRGVVPGELGLRWVACWCEGGGLGGKPQGREQAAREAFVDHERRDAAMLAALAVEGVLGEGAPFTLHLVQGIYPLTLGVGWAVS
jgi:hypothetical protein